VFIEGNLNTMRSLPPSKGEELTLYEEKKSRIIVNLNELVDTLYADNAYLLSSIDNST